MRSPGKTAAIVAVTTTIGIGAVLSGVLVADSLLVLRDAGAKSQVAAVTERENSTVNRENKADALAAPQRSQPRIEIKTVEVVGIRDAAIVYRDRDGNILFRTDPVANVTVVAKNVDLPEVTIRDTADAKVRRMSVDRAEPPEQPQGCESAFARPSPMVLTRLSSRCLAQITAQAKLASLD